MWFYVEILNFDYHWEVVQLLNNRLTYLEYSTSSLLYLSIFSNSVVKYFQNICSTKLISSSPGQYHRISNFFHVIPWPHSWWMWNTNLIVPQYILVHSSKVCTKFVNWILTLTRNVWFASSGMYSKKFNGCTLLYNVRILHNRRLLNSWPSLHFKCKVSSKTFVNIGMYGFNSSGQPHTI